MAQTLGLGGPTTEPAVNEELSTWEPRYKDNASIRAHRSIPISIEQSIDCKKLRKATSKKTSSSMHDSKLRATMPSSLGRKTTKSVYPMTRSQPSSSALPNGRSLNQRFLSLSLNERKQQGIPTLGMSL